MVKISPSLFNVNDNELIKVLKEVPNADYFHVDVAHPRFVETADGEPSLFCDPTVFQRVAGVTSVPLDVHLMVKDPKRWVERYVSPSTEYITFHVESDDDPEAVITEIRKHDLRPGIALNPDTPLSKIEHLLKEVDLVLLMSVVPGQGGQGYISKVTDKIRALNELIKEKGLGTAVEVDGGIKLDNRYEPIVAGADILVSGTGIFNHSEYSPQEAVEMMKDVILLACDHGGYERKEELKGYLADKKIPHTDLGCYSEKSVDFPDYADRLVGGILSGEYQRGVLICGTGSGMGIRANRYRRIRAVKCNSLFDAQMARGHNDSNVLCIGGRTTDLEMVKGMFNIWHDTSFEDTTEEQKYRRRNEMLDS